MPGTKLDVTHGFSGAFQKAGWIRELRSTEESDIDVSGECIDVGECSIADARGRLIIVHHLANIISARPKNVEPLPRDGTQFAGLLFHPGTDSGVPLDRSREPKETVHLLPDDFFAFTARMTRLPGMLQPEPVICVPSTVRHQTVVTRGELKSARQQLSAGE